MIHVNNQNGSSEQSTESHSFNIDAIVDRLVTAARQSAAARVVISLGNGLLDPKSQVREEFEGLDCVNVFSALSEKLSTIAEEISIVKELCQEAGTFEKAKENYLSLGEGSSMSFSSKVRGKIQKSTLRMIAINNRVASMPEYENSVSKSDEGDLNWVCNSVEAYHVLAKKIHKILKESIQSADKRIECIKKFDVSELPTRNEALTFWIVTCDALEKIILVLERAVWPTDWKNIQNVMHSLEEFSTSLKREVKIINLDLSPGESPTEQREGTIAAAADRAEEEFRSSVQMYSLELLSECCREVPSNKKNKLVAKLSDIGAKGVCAVLAEIAPEIELSPALVRKLEASFHKPSASGFEQMVTRLVTAARREAEQRVVAENAAKMPISEQEARDDFEALDCPNFGTGLLTKLKAIEKDVSLLHEMARITVAFEGENLGALELSKVVSGKIFENGPMVLKLIERISDLSRAISAHPIYKDIEPVYNTDELNWVVNSQDIHGAISQHISAALTEIIEWSAPRFDALAACVREKVVPESSKASDLSLDLPKTLMSVTCVLGKMEWPKDCVLIRKELTDLENLTSRLEREKNVLCLSLKSSVLQGRGLDRAILEAADRAEASFRSSPVMRSLKLYRECQEDVSDGNENVAKLVKQLASVGPEQVVEILSHFAPDIDLSTFVIGKIHIAFKTHSQSVESLARNVEGIELPSVVEEKCGPDSLNADTQPNDPLPPTSALAPEEELVFKQMCLEEIGLRGDALINSICETAPVGYIERLLEASRILPKGMLAKLIEHNLELANPVSSGTLTPLIENVSYVLRYAGVYEGYRIFDPFQYPEHFSSLRTVERTIRALRLLREAEGSVDGRNKAIPQTETLDEADVICQQLDRRGVDGKFMLTLVRDGFWYNGMFAIGSRVMKVENIRRGMPIEYRKMDLKTFNKAIDFLRKNEGIMAVGNQESSSVYSLPSDPSSIPDNDVRNLISFALRSRSNRHA